MFKSKLLYLTTVVLSVMLFSNIANAQQVTLDTYNESDAQEESNGVVDFIPLMQKQVKAIGAVPPKPFFIAPMFFYLNENRNVTNVVAKIINGDGSLTTVPGVAMKSVNSETFSTGIRGGFWLFPFLSIYGMYAYTEGTTNFEMDTSNVSGDTWKDIMSQVDTTTHIFVHTGGVGITAAYGMKDLFFKSDVFSNIDVNSSWSKVNLLDDLMYTITVSMRAGVSKNFAKHFRTSVWVGGMFRGGSSTGTQVGGTYPAGALQTMYTAHQSALSPWSMVAGLQIGISRYFDIITEFGFLNRFQANVNISFNF